jgi:hypothetical protein
LERSYETIWCIQDPDLLTPELWEYAWKHVRILGEWSEFCKQLDKAFKKGKIEPIGFLDN